ncbi:major facilitator superfamily domain-containing protein [Halenospora varia]|nr:major facilitator superfamily domain-containing protein [Halenospora varia]
MASPAPVGHVSDEESKAGAINQNFAGNETKRIYPDTKEQTENDTTEVGKLEQWNNPKSNIFRYLATLYSFTILGMVDASFGALIPYLETYYNITYTVVSLVFLAPFLGYSMAAVLNNRIHMRFGQLGIAIISPICKIIAFTVMCVHPPYPVLPVILVLSGFGSGLEDSGWNAWVGNMENANELLGFLHGAYGLGATISPLIATAMVTKGHLQWYTFYYLLVGLAALELLICTASFRHATGAAYRAANPVTPSPKGGSSRTKESLQNHITWMLALFLLCYVGVEVSLGGWLVTFMLRVRHGGDFESGLVVTGFWLGLTFGRVILGFVTGKIGEKLAIACYLLICIVFELCFWLIPNFISSAIFAGWLGFFLGPLFPAAIVVATKVLPKRLHVSAIGFAAAFGGGGAALLPFAVGAIAQVKGVQVLQPIALALIVAILILWGSLPGGFSKGGLEKFSQEKETNQVGGENITRMTRLKRKFGLGR